MKKINLFLIAFVLATELNAQDIITRNDSSKVSASISEINQTVIKYKLFNYADGPLITTNKTDVAYIVFKNGAVERFAKVNAAQRNETYNPNKYNLDDTPVTLYEPVDNEKRYEKLYLKKNYLGFNYVAFLNTCLGFNYMRDIKKLNTIINIPFAIGFGNPSITNSLYSNAYLDGTSSTKYTQLQYQIGANVLFAPSMVKAVNFLIGPSFVFTSLKVSVNTKYTSLASVPGQYNDALYQNNFKLYREHYGINVGLLARFSKTINMNALITFGYKKDTYSQKDPYGIDYINSNSKNQNTARENVMPYVNFLWSVGYRF